MKNRENQYKPKTILTGGVFGVGKTTLSYNLSCRLGIKQRTSVGVITKTLKYLDATDQNLRSIDDVDKENDGFKLFDKQAKKICSIVNYILKVSHEDGTDYILDGVQLIPRYLKMDKNTTFFFIKAPQKEIFRKRLNTSMTHPIRYRNLNESQVEKILSLEKYLLSMIRENRRIKILDGNNNEEEITREALKILNDLFKGIL